MKRIAILLLVFLAIGCGSRELTGTWEIMGGPTPSTITFKEDGTFRIVATVGQSSTTGTGKYTLEGDKIKMFGRTSEVSWRGSDELELKGEDGISMTLKRKD